MSEADAKAVVEAPKKRQKVRDTSDELWGPHILNVATFPDGYPRPYNGPSIPAAELAERMYQDLKALYAKYLSADGWHVDYDGLRHSEEMTKMVQTMEAFQTLNLGELSVTTRKAVCLNLYNLLCIHVVLHTLEPGATSGDWENFFTHNAYVIGGAKYSLDDIEHGLVREDRASGKPGPHFAADDARRQFRIPLDLRAHAAMVCAGKGCPVIRLYSPANVEKELDEAMSGFVMRDTTVDVPKKTVLASRIFEWYDNDFGADVTERVRVMHKYASGIVKEQLAALLADGGADVKITYRSYNWTLNGNLTSRF